MCMWYVKKTLEKTLQSGEENTFLHWFVMEFRVKENTYHNGCRYNERLNAKTEGCKTSHLHWVVRVNLYSKRRPSGHSVTQYEVVTET